MPEQRFCIAQRQSLGGRMYIHGEGNRTDGLNGFGHEPAKASRPKHQWRGLPASAFDTKRNLRQKTQVIGNAKRTEPRKRMSIAQTKMNRFAVRTENVHQIA